MVMAVILVTFVSVSVQLANAQQPGKVPRIGFLDSRSASDPQNAVFREAFLQGLRDLGYVEGKNINIDYRYDEGESERLHGFAEELVRQGS